ncbi:hypothetical protein Lbys_0879 [Leadbetterella byssophila DSM 17132]|uniref:Lipocalin-like domain-containing protein n=1 Tax=Leadbetterella byssophila (strain DSM 17132 / JCM 16389 / KACC 11308 / NBRC 106382 / 4M15) TaxID=649349 RepID=E4RR30_LEAB4|nr:hypothetical protein Lbys_0879 [Leadbetterella byssophila DSM 17132]
MSILNVIVQIKLKSTLKNFVLISFFALIFLACEDPNVGSEDAPKKELISKRSWQLDKYTTTSGNTISDGQLNSAAKMLYGLAFTFSANGSVQGLDKVSKNIINKGVWTIEEDDTTLDIDIDGFEGEFEIVRINNTSMVLKAKTENHLIGVGPEVQLVFSEYKL